MKKLYNSRGQALVEFVILLTVLLVIISGMLYFFQLHLFQFWTQQEARYLAFEQTWVPQGYYEAEGRDPEELLEGTAPLLVRPRLLSKLSAIRDTISIGSMTDLISPLALNDGSQETELMLNSPLVEAAFASQHYSGIESDPTRSLHNDTLVSNFPELDRVVQERLRLAGFGEKYCLLASEKISKFGFKLSATQFSSLHCAQEQERLVANYISRAVSVPEIFRDLAERLDNGLAVETALAESLSTAVAQGFYSYFSQEVENRFASAPLDIVAGRIDVGLDALDSSIGRMVAELRYVGSSAAVLAIIGKGLSVGTEAVGNRSSENELDFEKQVNALLHLDASSMLPLIGNGYLLNPSYLPVPPIFDRLAGGLFTGPMRTVLARDGDLIPSYIDESVRRISVFYDSTNGVISGAKRRFTKGVVLGTNFVIDTNPWHMERRIGHTGEYRKLGSEFDSADGNTEEALLRRRVEGLWMLPTPPEALFDPILALADMDELNALVGSVRPFGSMLSKIKSFINDNPLTSIADFLAKIPVISALVPRQPKWPAVRPDAYPRSEEIKDDRKMGTSRTFDDYIAEQKKFNPPPNPKFN